MKKVFLSDRLGFAYYVKNEVGKPNTYLAQVISGVIYRVTPDSTGSLKYGIATRAAKQETIFFLNKTKQTP